MLRKLYYVYKMNKSHHTPFILFVFFPSVESVALCLQTTEMNKSSKQMIPLFVQKLSKHHSVKMEVVFFLCLLSSDISSAISTPWATDYIFAVLALSWWLNC